MSKAKHFSHINLDIIRMLCNCFTAGMSKQSSISRSISGIFKVPSFKYPETLLSFLQGFGQWSSAQFNSSEQQQKFLRLMGGFKKSFQPSSESTGGGNMALGKDAQQQLQQGLLGEFERAQSRRMDFSNRGAGLGFTAPSNKKFSIDINASRSVRFDD